MRYYKIFLLKKKKKSGKNNRIHKQGPNPFSVYILKFSLYSCITTADYALKACFDSFALLLMTGSILSIILNVFTILLN